MDYTFFSSFLCKPNSAGMKFKDNLQVASYIYKTGVHSLKIKRKKNPKQQKD